MAVDTQTLISELQNYGTVDFCGVNNSKSYVVVLQNVITDEITIKNIIENYILTDYPIQDVMSLVNGVFKCQYSIN